MRRSNVLRALSATAILLLGGALTACAPAAPAPSADDAGSNASTAPSAAPAESQSPDADGGEEYAFGADRGVLATAVEAAFKTRNGSARWEGDTLILAVDGDASATMAGFAECRVLMHVLLEDDVSVIEFPNGQVACADVLPD